MKLMIPTVHMNGTSRKDLQDQLEHVVRAIGAAKAAMQEACPHDRDYYVQSPTAGPAAREQHRNRLRRLEAIEAEIFTIYEGIA